MSSAFTCQRCFKQNKDCQCDSGPSTWETEVGPRCPCCGEVNPAYDSDGILYNEDVDEYDCSSCSRRFSVSVFVKHSWSARQITE